jgi:hypothetical protein
MMPTDETRRELMASAKGEKTCIQQWYRGGVRGTPGVATHSPRAGVTVEVEATGTPAAAEVSQRVATATGSVAAASG